jgi:hypothetical protein
MQYISPIKLLDLQTPKEGEGISSNFLMRERKRLLAEFELQRQTTISIKGKELDKSQVLKVFDELADAIALQHHITIAQHPGLLNFMESGVVNEKSWNLDVERENDSSFRAFISPYFVEKYNSTLTKAVKKGDHICVANLANKPILTVPQDYDSCFSGAKRYFNQLLNQCKSYKKRTVAFQLKKIEKLYRHETIRLINVLPDYFGRFKDKYALALCNLSVVIYNSRVARGSWNKTMIAALKIQCSQEMKKVVRAKNHELIGYDRGKSESGSRGGCMSVIIGIVLINIIRMCVNSGASDEHTPRLNTTPATPTEVSMNDILGEGRIFKELDLFYLIGEKQLQKMYAYQVSVRPETGEEPYSEYLTTFRYPVDFGFMVHNNAAEDVVVFCHQEGHVVAHKFVRSGDTLRVPELTDGLHKVRFYFGTHWLRDVPVITEYEVGRSPNVLLKGAFLNSAPEFKEFITQDFDIFLSYDAETDSTDVYDMRKTKIYTFDITTDSSGLKIDQVIEPIL